MPFAVHSWITEARISRFFAKRSDAEADAIARQADHPFNIFRHPKIGKPKLVSQVTNGKAEPWEDC